MAGRAAQVNFDNSTTSALIGFQALETGEASFPKPWKKSRFRFPMLGKAHNMMSACLPGTRTAGQSQPKRSAVGCLKSSAYLAVVLLVVSVLVRGPVIIPRVSVKPGQLHIDLAPTCARIL